MLQRLRDADTRRAWDVLLLLVFLPGAAFWAFIVLVQPAGLGSHANIYTDAAATWVRGGDPWQVGPPAAVFAGPPPMLLPFVPFVGLPVDVTRLAWFVADLVIAAWVIRRLGMPAYWIAFPPLFSAIVLGHVEILVLAALVLKGPLAGLAAVVKPYAAWPLVAERRWGALAVTAIVLVVSLPFLPWTRFFEGLQAIGANLARQHVGDSAFGEPLLMAVGVAALLSLGLRRALWLGVPVLWPYAQPIYKVMTLPVLTPILALFWALPVPGATLLGIVAFAVLVRIDGVRALPPLLRTGIQPIARQPHVAASGLATPSSNLVTT